MSFIDSNGSISDPYRNFIHISRYARWIESEGRRETWQETVDRYCNFISTDVIAITKTVSDILINKERINPKKVMRRRIVNLMNKKLSNI